jgi:hypothetical protein
MDGELHGSKMMSSMNLVFVNSLLGICRLQSDCIYWTMVIVQVRKNGESLDQGSDSIAL